MAMSTGNISCDIRLMLETQIRRFERELEQLDEEMQALENKHARVRQKLRDHRVELERQSYLPVPR